MSRSDASSSRWAARLAIGLSAYAVSVRAKMGSTPCGSAALHDAGVLFCTPSGRIQIDRLFIPRPIGIRRFFLPSSRSALPGDESGLGRLRTYDGYESTSIGSRHNCQPGTYV